MFLESRNFACFVTYPIYFNTFNHAVKCSLSRVMLALRENLTALKIALKKPVAYFKL